MLPFPMMADDRMRDLIDGAVSRGLGLDGEWMATIRRELGREPSVTGGVGAGAGGDVC